MAASPLLGYNTNVRHLGKLFHIQTEDSGSAHGHIFTHLFADGGRIVASKKTTYAHYISTARYPNIVKQLMRESHKAMFIALRDGLFDEDEAEGARQMAAMEIVLPDAPATASAPTSAPPATAAASVPAGPPAAVSTTGLDLEALENAAAARLAEAQAAQTPSAPPSQHKSGSGTASRYAVTRPAAVSKPRSVPPAAGSVSIFGGDLLSEKSLDEVILSYLAEDGDD